MKHLIRLFSCCSFLLVFIMCNQPCPAQYFQWGGSMGGLMRDEGNSVWVNPDGSIYVKGLFSDTADFDPGPGVFPFVNGNLSRDLFVTKLDSSGALLWAKAIGGNYHVEGINLVADSVGNTYIASTFQQTVDCDPGPGTSNLTSTGGNDIFFVKLDPNGNFLWAKKIGATGSENVNTIGIDGAGNIVLVGGITTTTDFDPGTGVHNLQAPNQSDVFIAKYTTNGDYIWAKSFGGPGALYLSELSVDSTGEICLVGYFSGTIDFDPGASVQNLTATAPGQNFDNFILRLSPSGSLVWVKMLEVDETGISAFTVNLQPQGNILVGGNFVGPMDADPGSGVLTLTPSGASDFFVMKLDPTGNLVWAERIGGSNGDAIFSIESNQRGEIYISGHISNSVDFDPGPGVHIVTVGTYNPYVCKLDSMGAFVWAKGFVCSGAAQSLSMTIDELDNVYFTGQFFDLFDLDPDAGTYNVSPVGVQDVFVAKIGTCPNVDLGSDTLICPTCSLTLGGSISGLSFLWSTGDTTRTIDITTPGTYSVTATSESGCQRSDTITVTVEAVGTILLAMATMDIRPNPAASNFVVSYSLQSDVDIRIMLYDELGRLVGELVNAHQSSGRRVFNVDATKMPVGIYYLTLQAGEKRITKKLAIHR